MEHNISNLIHEREMITSRMERMIHGSIELREKSNNRYIYVYRRIDESEPHTRLTLSLAKEAHDVTNDQVKVCRLTPGIMITEFITSANGGNTHIELPEKTKKVYNILGDYPEVIADYCVPRMLKNEKNNYNVVWLSNARAFRRFLFAGFNKRDFFK